MTATTIYKTWLARIASGVFTKSQCQQWAHAVVALAEGAAVHGKKTNLTHLEAGFLMREIRKAGGVRLTDEHSSQGLIWLERYASKRLPQLPDDWRSRFSHFLFMGEGHDSAEGHTYRSAYVPVWRIVLTDGEAWEYFACAWKSGYRTDDAWRVAS